MIYPLLDGLLSSPAARPSVGLRPTLIAAQLQIPGRVVGVGIWHPLLCHSGRFMRTVGLAGIGKARHRDEWQQNRRSEKIFAPHGFYSRSSVKRACASPGKARRPLSGFGSRRGRRSAASRSEAADDCQQDLVPIQH